MKKTKSLLLTLLVFISLITHAQNTGAFKMLGEKDETIVLDTTYSSYAEIFPFQTDKKIFGLSISADIVFESENSLVRLILVDEAFNEYLIYETYSLLADQQNFNVQDVCEETDMLNGIKPYSIIVEVIDARIGLISLNISSNGLDAANGQMLKDKKQLRNKEKIKKINKNLEGKGKHWRAGMTSVAALSYGERKKLYGSSDFPSGFEFYSGGIISAGEVLKSATISEMVNEWDWRNRHGQNWITPVKNQGGCGSCWAFSVTGTTEAMVKVYFNQSDLNLDLAEQDVLSCSGAGDCSGGFTSSALSYIYTTGIVDEGTFPYSGTDEPCENKGIAALELIQTSGQIYIGSTEYPRTEDGMKKMLIEKGPLSISISDWSHAIVLVGWKVVEEGDVFFSRWKDEDSNFHYQTITIEDGDPLIGTTVWIMKNSWGEWWGDEGYVYVQSDILNLYTRAIVTPIISNIQTYEVVCEDNDGDGYYWWGLGEKPVDCNCPDIADGDDSDPNLGPLDEYGNCTILGNLPLAAFSASDQNIYIGDEVEFTDESTGGAMSWYWEFGDGGTSTLRNPVHTYVSEGEYSVTLIVSNTYGADTLIKENYIAVNENVWYRQDSLALVALYNSTDGPNWTRNDNWLSGPLNTWYGIELNDSNRVSEIDLYGNNLQEQLPEELGNLSALVMLNLANNNLVEIIPQTWEPNPNLWMLDLSQNQLSGVLPMDWSSFTNLSYLYLNNNQLTDSLPGWFAGLSNLSYLQLAQNHFFGPIPESWGELQLWYLNLAVNDLTGSLPDCIAFMPELYQLNLGSNDFSGTLPESWAEINSIQYLYLYNNQLSGSLPDWLGNWRWLTNLYLNNNQFSGEIPVNWMNLSNLYYLDLSSNQLEGNLPIFNTDSIEGSMFYLNLRHNNFTGEVPGEWSSNQFLDYLDISENQLSGPIPAELCLLDTLTYVDFSYNYFDSSSCSTIQCMIENGVQFADEVQMQQNDIELLTVCNQQDTLFPLELALAVTGPYCNDDQGMVEVSISGGLGGSYTYGGQNQEALSDNNSYVVMIYDLILQEYIVEQALADGADDTLFFLPPGDYTVIIEDNADNDMQEMITIQEPDELVLDINVIGLSCLGDTAALVVEGFGGVEPYNYTLLRNGEIYYPASTTNYFSVPPDGLYEIVVQDANGCEAYDSLFIENPEPVNFSIQDITCYGDQTATVMLNMESEQENAIVFYSLYEDDVEVSFDSSYFSGSVKIIPDLLFDDNSLVDRYYTFKIVNRFGCSTADSIKIFNPVQEPLSFEVNVLSRYESDADILLNIRGGTPPYFVDLNGMAIDDMYQSVPLGNHFLYIRDAHNCYIADTILIPYIDCQQHFHPVWEGNGVYEAMNIYIIDAKIDGQDLVPGDQVGVFDGELCVGFGMVEETINHQNLLNIIVSADDGSGNGFTAGHDVSYKLWRCDEEMEFDVNNVQCFDNQLNPISCSAFNSGGTSFVQLNAISQVNFGFNLRTGWNIFSVPVIPDSADLEFVFSDLINDNTLVKIQDETGASMEDIGVFGGWTNYIGNVRPTEGYKIKLNEYDSLYISGSMVDYPFAIPLNPGWNIIGFPSFDVVDGMDVVQQLIDNGTLIKVQNEQGNSIENIGVFGGWQNFIGNFWAGKGFKIKVTNHDTLWVYESYPKSFKIQPKSAKTTHFVKAYTGNGVDHMNFNLVELSEELLSIGDELAVYDGITCVGAIKLSEENLRNRVVSIPASAKDNSGMTGFTEGNPYRLRMWDSEQNRENEIEGELISGAEQFTKNESAIISLEKSAITGIDNFGRDGVVEVNCYPNPFSDEITIELNLAKESIVKFEVLNLLGQSIKQFSSGDYLPSGIIRYSWHGENNAGDLVTNGIYYLNINVDGTVLNKKIVYSKMK